MIKTRLHRWDNEEFLEARYGNKCFWGSDVSGGLGGTAGSGGLGDPDFGGFDGRGGDGGPPVESIDVNPTDTTIDDAPYGNVGAGVGGYGPEGNPDVGDGPSGIPSPPPSSPPPSPPPVQQPVTSEGEETSEADLDYAKLIREQWEDYKDRYGPLEEYFSDVLQDDDFGEDIVNKARRAALRMDNAEATYRHLDRYGIDLGTNEKQALAGSMQRARIAQGQQNANTARQFNVNLQDALQKDFIGIGHGVSANATGQLGNVASMDIQRQTAIAQMKNSQQFALYQQQLQSQAAAEQMKYANKASRGGFWGTVLGIGGWALTGGNPAGFAAGYALGDWMAG
ncbi:MAG: hypothetical protein VW443_05225 [Pseudomonadales bacterium]